MQLRSYAFISLCSLYHDISSVRPTVWSLINGSSIKWKTKKKPIKHSRFAEKKWLSSDRWLLNMQQLSIFRFFSFSFSIYRGHILKWNKFTFSGSFQIPHHMHDAHIGLKCVAGKLPMVGTNMIQIRYKWYLRLHKNYSINFNQSAADQIWKY